MRLSFISGSVLAIIAAVCIVHADGPAPARFQRLNADDGLPLAGVATLMQDSRGFIWVGTFLGLSRFDGYKFVHYAKNSSDPGAISAVGTTAILETRAGRIWVGTTNGLNEYDEITDSFRKFNFAPNDPNGLPDNYVSTIFEDRESRLWVGTNSGGLSLFDPASLSFRTFRLPTSAGNSVTSIAEDAYGDLWLAAGGGLYRFDRASGIAHRVDTGTGEEAISSIIADPDGPIWFGTRSGLHKFDPQTGKIKAYTAAGRAGDLVDSWIRTVYRSPGGVLWAGTNAGASRYRPETDDFVSYRHDPADPTSLVKGEILAVLEDRNRQLWIGGTDGLNKFDQNTSRFTSFQHAPGEPGSLSSNEILSIHEDRAGIVWIGTRSRGRHGALNRYDPKDGRFSVVSALGDELVFSIYEDASGGLWLGARSGLFLMNPADGTVQKFRGTERTGSAMGVPGSIIAVTEDSHGQILAATIGSGMAMLDRASGQLVPFELSVVSPDRPTDNRVYAIVEDRQRNLWVGTAQGLERISSDRQTRRSYLHDPSDPTSLSANDVGSIYEDSLGRIWIGTSSGGLNRYDPAADNFVRFSKTNGLPSNDVFGIMEDGQGNLWLCTDRGLARFTAESGMVRTYNMTDGVPNNPFDNKTAFRNSKGEMYFGGQNGFVKFDPADFNDSSFEPPIYLTDVRVFEQPLRIGRNPAFLKELELSWRDYVVSFDFAALDTTDPSKLRYQWKLEGFDPEWIHGETRRTATYSNLSGGDYVLMVRATNVDGVWTGETRLLNIRVQPPFFRTFWFWGLVALAASFLIFVFYRYRIGQLRAISEAQTRFTQQLITSQEAERKRIAAELHDGLGQSLVIIKNRAMLGLNRADDLDRVAKELGSISDSASQALDEVREITNNLRPQLLDRLGLTKAIAAMLKKYAGVIDISSEIDPIDDIFDEHEEISIYRIIQESVNNVIKHSNAQKASVKVKRGEHHVEIEVKDNGIGFDVLSVPPEKRGFGLTGLRERAQLLGGELQIESRPGSGTKVFATFPVPANKNG